MKPAYIKQTVAIGLIQTKEGLHWAKDVCLSVTLPGKMSCKQAMKQHFSVHFRLREA